MLANTLKTTAIAALLGLGVAGAANSSASADTIRTRCNGDDCVRLRCNDFGDDCFRIGYFDRNEYLPYGYTRTYHYYYPDTYVAPDYTYYDSYHDYDDDYPRYGTTYCRKGRGNPAAFFFARCRARPHRIVHSSVIQVTPSNLFPT